MTRFAGRTAIVTGASRGIGFAIARRLADEGAALLIAALDGAELDAAASALRASGASVVALAGDLADAQEPERIVSSALAAWGHIDVLINNAGVDAEAPFLAIEPAEWDRALTVMLRAPFLLSQLAGREMVRQRRGSIVNIASIDGRGVDGPYASYDVAKAGLLMLTRNIAVELGPLGVRCNSVSPGWVLTKMVEDATAPHILERMKSAFGRVPLGRLLTVEEVAAACVFLASDEASGITGTDLTVDGGTEADLHVLASLDSER